MLMLSRLLDHLPALARHLAQALDHPMIQFVAQSVIQWFLVQ